MNNFKTFEKIEKNGSTLEFNEMQTERGSLYTVRIYTKYINPNYMFPITKESIRIVKSVFPIYSFNEAYATFKRWSKTF